MSGQNSKCLGAVLCIKAGQLRNRIESHPKTLRTIFFLGAALLSSANASRHASESTATTNTSHLMMPAAVLHLATLTGKPEWQPWMRTLAQQLFLAQNWRNLGRNTN